MYTYNAHSRGIEEDDRLRQRTGGRVKRPLPVLVMKQHAEYVQMAVIYIYERFSADPNLPRKSTSRSS